MGRRTILRDSDRRDVTCDTCKGKNKHYKGSYYTFPCRQCKAMQCCANGNCHPQCACDDLDVNAACEKQQNKNPDVTPVVEKKQEKQEMNYNEESIAEKKQGDAGINAVEMEIDQKEHADPDVTVVETEQAKEDPDVIVIDKKHDDECVVTTVVAENMEEGFDVNADEKKRGDTDSNAFEIEIDQQEHADPDVTVVETEQAKEDPDVIVIDKTHDDECENKEDDFDMNASERKRDDADSNAVENNMDQKEHDDSVELKRKREEDKNIVFRELGKKESSTEDNCLRRPAGFGGYEAKFELYLNDKVSALVPVYNKMTVDGIDGMCFGLGDFFELEDILYFVLGFTVNDVAAFVHFYVANDPGSKDGPHTQVSGINHLIDLSEKPDAKRSSIFTAGEKKDMNFNLVKRTLKNYTYDPKISARLLGKKCNLPFLNKKTTPVVKLPAVKEKEKAPSSNNKRSPAAQPKAKGNAPKSKSNHVKSSSGGKKGKTDAETTGPIMQQLNVIPPLPTMPPPPPPTVMTQPKSEDVYSVKHLTEVAILDQKKIEFQRRIDSEINSEKHKEIKDIAAMTKDAALEGVRVALGVERATTTTSSDSSIIENSSSAKRPPPLPHKEIDDDENVRIKRKKVSVSTLSLPDGINKVKAFLIEKCEIDPIILDQPIAVVVEASKILCADDLDVRLHDELMEGGLSMKLKLNILVDAIFKGDDPLPLPTGMQKLQAFLNSTCGFPVDKVPKVPLEIIQATMTALDCANDPLMSGQLKECGSVREQINCLVNEVS